MLCAASCGSLSPAMSVYPQRRLGQGGARAARGESAPRRCSRAPGPQRPLAAPGPTARGRKRCGRKADAPRGLKAVPVARDFPPAAVLAEPSPGSRPWRDVSPVGKLRLGSLSPPRAERRGQGANRNLLIGH